MAQALTTETLQTSYFENGVLEWVQCKGIRASVNQMTQLASDTLPLAARLVLSKVQDPESGVEWIEVSAKVRGERSAVREAHRRITRAWLALAPRENSTDVRLAITFI